MEALKEFQKESPNSARTDQVLRSVDARIHELELQENGPLQGRVPYSEYWLVDGDKYVGMIQIRHRASGRLPSTASHIYYEIRPTLRGMGYATEILRLGLGRGRALGLRRILIGCDSNNIASRRIIERNGGKLLDEVTVPDSTFPWRKYEINLDSGVGGQRQ